MSFFGDDREGEKEMTQALVLQSDFGISDGAVSAMYGVAHSIDPKIRIFDLTHDIPPFHIWEASYRLVQTVPYWRKETVFVSVVDPGVGSNRKSIVARTHANQFILTPDNGTLTHLVQSGLLADARILDDTIHRLPVMGESYTFHGRDIYAYTGARLSSQVISYEEVGPLIPLESLVLLERQVAAQQGEVLHGIIEILDVRFGNVWTNIPAAFTRLIGLNIGCRLGVEVMYNKQLIFSETLTFGHSFADVELGVGLVYINSLDQLAIALNQSSFADRYQVGIGNEWQVRIQKVEE